jgi:hypothetical protein
MRRRSYLRTVRQQNIALRHEAIPRWCAMQTIDSYRPRRGVALPRFSRLDGVAWLPESLRTSSTDRGTAGCTESRGPRPVALQRKRQKAVRL